MFNTEPQSSPETPPPAAVTPAADAPTNAATRSLGREIIESTQIVLTALVLAFIFRAFLVEAFIIPTGSMAETLCGAHGTYLCPACGWEFDYGPQSSGAAPDAPFEPPASVLCPNCHAVFDLRPEFCAPKAGDRILVHKWPYALGGWFGPRRWDVIVFRNPADPAQNYIKRLVGLPGESVEIIQGDLYINGKIARKTAAAQRALWFVCFDQNFMPTAYPGTDDRPRWTAEDGKNEPARGWSGLDTRVIRYAELDETPRGLLFNRDGSRLYLQDVYGYNGGASGVFSGDVRIVAEFTPRAGNGACRWEWARGPRSFAAQIQRDGLVTLTLRTTNAGGPAENVQYRQLPPFPYDRPLVVEFGHVDYRVYLKIDGRELLATTDEQYAPDLEQLRHGINPPPPRLRIVARALALELRGLRIDRDVYYTYNPGATLRADAGNAFRLESDEYFVLGDNSPRSHDSREWDRKSPHLRGHYRLGTVRADQIVGQAFFVYLPGLLPLDAQGRWRLPDIGRARFIR